MRSRRWPPIGMRLGLGIVLATLPPAGSGCAPKAETTARADARPRPVPVTVAPIRQRPVERFIAVVGTLKGWEEVTIGAKKGGRVLQISHDMGDRVEPGEPLLALETIDADLAVDQARKRLLADLAKLGLNPIGELSKVGLSPATEATEGRGEVPEPVEALLKDALGRLARPDFVETVPAVVKAKVALERAQRNFGRERQLSGRGAGTLQDYQNAENDLKAAEVGLDVARVTTQSDIAGVLASKVALDVARQARDDLVIRAPVPSARPRDHQGPISYAVSERTVAEGQMLREGDPVFELVVEDPLRLWASVPERFSPSIRLGQEVRVRVGSQPGTTFAGTVTRINPAVDPVSRTFQVEASVPNAEGVLRPGGFAKGEIVTRRDAEAVVVPLEAVVQFAGVTKIFIIQGDSSQPVAHEVQVQTGLQDEKEGWIEVVGDLPPNSVVVTTGQTVLADGTSVVIRDPEAETAPPADPAL